MSLLHKPEAFNPIVSVDPLPVGKGFSMTQTH